MVSAAIHLPTVNLDPLNKNVSSDLLWLHGNGITFLTSNYFHCSLLNDFIAITTLVSKKNPCKPSPCGSNALCENGQCRCPSEYNGNPYVECRPECVLNTDCPRENACINNKCVDPCPGTCAASAICEVFNHIPMCHCPEGMLGNAFFACRAIECNYLLICLF